jgi:hypothetical protein
MSFPFVTPAKAESGARDANSDSALRQTMTAPRTAVPVMTPSTPIETAWSACEAPTPAVAALGDGLAAEQCEQGGFLAAAEAGDGLAVRDPAAVEDTVGLRRADPR